jgi:hypothetical protein
MNNCIAFYNFGNKCVLELLVATYTLRKHYTGKIVWMLSKNDPWNLQLVKQIEHLKVDVVWREFNSFKKNTKSAIKPYLFKELFGLGFDSVIMCDGDLLFLRPIDELSVKLQTKGILLTQFCDWRTSGKIMSGRLIQMEGIIDNGMLKGLLKNLPAVNIGVMGFTKNAIPQLDAWAEVTAKLAGKHIADEIAAHILIPAAYIAPPTYNASAKVGDLSHIEDNHVVHFHGGSQGGGEADLRYEDRRRSSRLWMAHLYDMYNSGLIPEAKMWEQYSTGGVFEILQANPNLPFECSQEFQV